MSTYYTAPAIYNTGGWGTRGDTPSFNPTGIVVPTGETGKAFLAVSRADYYFDSKRRFNFELSSSFTQSRNLKRISYELSPSFTQSRDLRRVNYSFSPDNLEYIKSKNGLIKFDSFKTLSQAKKYKIDIGKFNVDIFNLPKLNYRYRRENYFKNYSLVYDSIQLYCYNLQPTVWL